jgi:excisionase family DNA binding protein
MSVTPLLISIPEACQRVSIGRSALYLLMADGSIDSRKAGKRRLVVVASLEAWVAALPTEPLKSTAKGN